MLQNWAILTKTKAIMNLVVVESRVLLNFHTYFRFVGVLELNPDIKSICQRTRNAIKGMVDDNLQTKVKLENLTF